MRKTIVLFRLYIFFGDKMKYFIIPLITFIITSNLIAKEKNVYFGDTHLHSSYSPDAYLMGNRTADPDTAFKYAKGLPVVHPYNRAKIQINTPLDFLVITDHSEYMGVIPKIFEGDPLVANTKTGKRWKKWSDAGKPQKAFAEAIKSINESKPIKDINSKKVRRGVWQKIIDITEKHNEPGKFTTFIGWEWSSTPKGANLHRIIFQKGGAETAKKYLPFSSLDSAKPEDLWKWLSKTSEAIGEDFLAIPHNQNISKGLMFPLVDSYGNLITAEYSKERMRWEPVIETTQIKGDSETHPMLSPNDEFADYETYDHLIQIGKQKNKSMFGHSFIGKLSQKELNYLRKNYKKIVKKGDYSRTALLRGLVLEKKIGVNPYKFGMIGSTDSHTAMSSAEEDNFWGKMGIDSTPENRLNPKLILLPPDTKGIDMGAAGIAVVWAEENTRDAIFEAFKRKEVYATTGTRIKLRFYGGYKFRKRDARRIDKIGKIGSKKGVPMGAELSRSSSAPTFLVHAIKDPKHANLDRIQIIKGWADKNGSPQEKIYNVALSDERVVKSDGSSKPVGNTVDLKTGKWSDNIGDAELTAYWEDPDFNKDLRAFYYVRVLQIPTPRHTLYDAIALGVPHPKKSPATIQERAYSSPIWYNP